MRWNCKACRTDFYIGLAFILMLVALGVAAATGVFA